MSVALNAAPWRWPPHCILGLGLADDPIPLVPPDGFAGLAGCSIMNARTRAAMKAIPDWELLAFFLMGPDLVYAPESRDWAGEQESQLTTVRRAARAAAKDGDTTRYLELLAETRRRWRRVVQRSIGYKLPRQAPVLWL